MSQIEFLDVGLIDVAPGRRALDPAWAMTLAEQFSATGQRTPIEVVQADDRYRLVFGLHRLEAARLNGTAVKAEVKQPGEFASEADLKLAEIVENLVRRELSVLDRAFDIAAWREIYEAQRGAVKRGGDRRSVKAKQDQSANLALWSESGVDPALSDPVLAELSAKFALNFSDAAQQALGISPRAIYRALKIASIAPSVRAKISLQPVADNQSELLLLADQDPDLQARIADLLIAEPPVIDKVSEALALILGQPNPETPAAWERLSNGFSKLGEREQDRFFDTQEAAITRWLAKRGGR